MEPVQAIAIGASAGALDALFAILPALAADDKRAVFVVVHLPPDKDSMLVSLLAARCAMRVKEAEDKEPVCPGTIYLAPPNYHLLVETDFRLSLSADEQVHYSRPAIDVLFESAADAYGPALLGIVLTGANEDGAEGLAAIAAAEGLCLVQDPAEAYAAAMPEAARKRCPSARTLSLAEIASYLKSARC